ncbi:hypothetical protein [Amycolatopsis thailandensis]|uniref:PPE family domain-containing protein n=1 Tax=Amycolatopsis thailandensis TaxID=589330 RepID=A0A229SEH9_9PSEU|nr:hypothetical protein [Amycolatopsis thailandensis]OXM57318.1 hypothetical protein CFP71_08580 [Amycolatopsis thailandensis]
MTAVYNPFPMEVLMGMIHAELANVPTLHDAAKMWTEARAWIDEAQVKLNSRVSELTPEWTDNNGRQLQEKMQRSIAELKFWGDRIDMAKPAETLTTLASGITEAHQTMLGLEAAYSAAVSASLLNPLAAMEALAIQQAAGSRMTALGGQFDLSMLQVVEASGIKSPDHMVPTVGPAAEGNTPADFIKAAQAGMDTLSEFQGLGESLGVGGGGSGSDVSLPEIPGYDGSSGVSLAGLAPSQPLAGAVPSLGGLPGGSGSAPMPSGLLGGLGAAGGLAGLPVAAKPVGAKKAPSLASEVLPGTATPSGAKAAASPMSPMTPPNAGGQNTAGTLRPSSGDQPTGRNGAARRAASGKSDGVPVKLRGRAANGAPDTGFTLARGRRSGESESGSVQMLDEDLWRR